MTSDRVIPAAVIAALLALNWYAARRVIDIEPIAKSDTSIEAPRSNNAAHVDTAIGGELIEPGTDATDVAFLERPLFSPTRRPRDPQNAVAPAAEASTRNGDQPTATDAPSGLRLIGVLQIGKNDARALIRAAGTPNGTWLAPGGEMNGWRVSRIERDRAVIAKDGGTEQLVLRRYNADDAR